MLSSLLTSALALALLAGPAPGWDGVYSYTQDGGRTAGGSPILVTWRLTLKGEACEFHGEGFQTLETFQCTAHATPQGLEVRFLRYPPPATGNRFGVEVYKPGAPLFTLSRLQGRVLTRWTGFVPDEGVARSPAPYLKKVK
ncbi:hypothetical protein G5B46_07535 [Caulobacter sp. 602-2]|uniref:DUF4124 domain-containing protein n=1 Tax=Caulobacter sp. 602-2 TaxID=2710887 RepID=A0A6G4QVE0_9CAUL|nr:DUF5991 domain-containing protein [Caulobacter sp. 602-2]NGM49453.1 hypothetical protein [Caulobacter sp. 602-2]